MLPLAPAGSRRARPRAPRSASSGRLPVGSELPARRRSGWRSRTATDAGELRGWLAATPDGIDLDLDLRWRILVRLAGLGATDRDELRAALDAEPTGESRVEHMRAIGVAARRRGQGARRGTSSPARLDVPNYELEAAGLGMWRGGQEELTAPYVDRYFDELPATVGVRSGWVLADATEFFFPVTSLTRGDARPGARGWRPTTALDLSVRRRLGRRGRRPGPQARRPDGVPDVMTLDRARRPGPTVRTRVHEVTDDGERSREDRLATEEPLEIRLAWPGAPARRVWVTMRTPGTRLRARGRVAGARGPGRARRRSTGSPTAPTPT